MKGDFSKRFSKKREQESNYKKVLLQQGRILTDSDWNEQVDIQDTYDRKYLTDVIGTTGVPFEQKESSFKITPIGGNKYTIGKGRIYVDGIMVENFSEVEAASQPYLPLSIVDETSEALPKEPGIYLAYLDTWDRHITYLDDPSIQESALGGPDTTTRSQIVWQVMLHRLADGETVEENTSVENKWGPWVSLNSKVSDIKIGVNKDGTLEVFAIRKTESQAGVPFGIVTSRKQISTDPDKWEDNWREELGDKKFLKIEVASNRNGLLELFAIERDSNNMVLKNSKLDDSSWKGWTNLNQLQANEIAVGRNKDGTLELFTIRLNDNIVYHSKQKDDLSDWEEWKPIGNLGFEKLSVITSAADARMEIYAIAKADGRIWFTRQKDSDSANWEDWIQLNTGAQLSFNEVAIGVNKNKQSVIFARDSAQGGILSTIRTDPGSPSGNGWTAVGNTIPGNPKAGLSVGTNVKKKDRVELFAVFSGTVWNISESESGQWNSDWKSMEVLKTEKVANATDRLSRLNVFAVDSGGSVYYTTQEDPAAALNCKSAIPSWESKIKSSSGQLQARTRPQVQPTDPCRLPELAGYKRLENQLYRIEIHEPKSSTKSPTFKYSRDNGAICTKVVNISGEKITVESTGRDRLLGFNSGQWIEITDDIHELWGIPGVLLFVKEVTGNDLIYDSTLLGPTPPVVDNVSFPKKLNPKVRRWDSPGSLEVTIPQLNDGFLPIEDGIEVKFSSTDDVYRTGDFWTIPARTLKADIEWPKGDTGVLDFVDIEGIEHHYVKLAFMEFTDTGELKLISDCRDFFPPLNTVDERIGEESVSMVIWTSGTNSQAEYPYLLENKPIDPELIGRGKIYVARFDTPLPHWFHFPMTINYQLNSDKKIILKEIYILYKTIEAKISHVRFCDGDRVVYDQEYSLSGDHSAHQDDSNTFRLDQEGIEIKQGISISVKVSFGSPQEPLGSVTFTSVGVQIEAI